MILLDRPVYWTCIADDRKNKVSAAYDDFTIKYNH